MKTVVVNIDDIGGLTGIQSLIDNNQPDFRLVTCGSTVIDMYIGNTKKVVNFAVFESDKDVNFYYNYKS